jgi:hypothetical protein
MCGVYSLTHSHTYRSACRSHTDAFAWVGGNLMMITYSEKDRDKDSDKDSDDGGDEDMVMQVGPTLMPLHGLVGT